MYGVVVVFLILQALYTLKLQYSHQVFRLYSASVLFYAAGFILWNLDNHHCPGISYIKSSLSDDLTMKLLLIIFNFIMYSIR